ncbi:MAG: hypothetical protein EHM24_08185, partial [Acidobacteria bacterium]
MNRHAIALPARTRAALSTLVLIVAIGAAYALPGAQAPAKKALSTGDYTKWRSIASPVLSGDGKWLAYVLQLT